MPHTIFPRGPPPVHPDSSWADPALVAPPHPFGNDTIPAALLPPPPPLNVYQPMHMSHNTWQSQPPQPGSIPPLQMHQFTDMLPHPPLQISQSPLVRRPQPLARIYTPSDWLPPPPPQQLSGRSHPMEHMPVQPFGNGSITPALRLPQNVYQPMQMPPNTWQSEPLWHGGIRPPQMQQFKVMPPPSPLQISQTLVRLPPPPIRISAPLPEWQPPPPAQQLISRPHLMQHLPVQPFRNCTIPPALRPPQNFYELMQMPPNTHPPRMQH